MARFTFKLPDIGEGIAEVEVVAWHVQPGDQVSEDQLLAEVMTDKATVEIPSPVVGTVLALGGTVGELMAVGGELVRIEVEGAGNQKEGPAGGKPDSSDPAPRPAARSARSGPSACRTSPCSPNATSPRWPPRSPPCGSWASSATRTTPPAPAR